MLQTVSFLRKLKISPYKNLAWFSTDSKKRTNSLDFYSSYNNQQIDKILEAVNSRSEDDLAIFNISKQRIRKIELRKKKQGQFKSIDDILELDGFGVKVLEKFCDSILQDATGPSSSEITTKTEDEENTSVSRKKPQFVSPVLLENNRKLITSCVSFHLDLNFIAWSKLSLGPDEGEPIRPIFVEDWMCNEIGTSEKKLSLSDIIRILIHFSEKIPYADVYVLEAMQMPQAAMQPGSPVQLSFNIQKAQLFSMLSILMASRGGAIEEMSMQKDDSEEKKQLKDQQRVFFLRNFLSSRLYKTYIGNERVSTEVVIENLLRYNYSKDQPPNYNFASIDVPMNLREYYEDSGRLDRDYMGQSLLNGLTFLKLCVLKCAKTAAILTKRSSSIV